jgi:hypothetical protein
MSLMNLMNPYNYNPNDPSHVAQLEQLKKDSMASIEAELMKEMAASTPAPVTNSPAALDLTREEFLQILQRAVQEKHKRMQEEQNSLSPIVEHSNSTTPTLQQGFLSQQHNVSPVIENPYLITPTLQQEVRKEQNNVLPALQSPSVATPAVQQEVREMQNDVTPAVEYSTPTTPTPQNASFSPKKKTDLIPPSQATVRIGGTGSVNWEGSSKTSWKPRTAAVGVLSFPDVPRTKENTASPVQEQQNNVSPAVRYPQSTNPRIGGTGPSILGTPSNTSWDPNGELPSKLSFPKPSTLSFPKYPSDGSKTASGVQQQQRNVSAVTERLQPTTLADINMYGRSQAAPPSGVNMASAAQQQQNNVPTVIQHPQAPQPTTPTAPKLHAPSPTQLPTPPPSGIKRKAEAPVEEEPIAKRLEPENPFERPAVKTVAKSPETPESNVTGSETQPEVPAEPVVEQPRKVYKPVRKYDIFDDDCPPEVFAELVAEMSGLGEEEEAEAEIPDISDEDLFEDFPQVNSTELFPRFEDVDWDQLMFDYRDREMPPKIKEEE